MTTKVEGARESEGRISPHPMRRVGPRRREDIGKPASSDLPAAIAPQDTQRTASEGSKGADNEHAKRN